MSQRSSFELSYAAEFDRLSLLLRLHLVSMHPYPWVAPVSVLTQPSVVLQRTNVQSPLVYNTYSDCWFVVWNNLKKSPNETSQFPRHGIRTWVAFASPRECERYGLPWLFLAWNSTSQSSNMSIPCIPHTPWNLNLNRFCFIFSLRYIPHDSYSVKVQSHVNNIYL